MASLSREARESLKKMRRAWVDGLDKRITRTMREVLDDSAKQVTDMQRALVPVDQGDLRDSIGYSMGTKDLNAVIEAGDTASADHTVLLTRRKSGKRVNAYYGVIVEYGSANRPATPFFWPAWRALKKLIWGRLKRAFRKALKEHGR